MLEVIVQDKLRNEIVQWLVPLNISFDCWRVNLTKNGGFHWKVRIYFNYDHKSEELMFKIKYGELC